MALAAACDGDDLRLATRQARAIAREAAALGVNTVFGPVLDPVPPACASDSGTRSFSGNRRQLAAYADAYIRGLQAGGVCAVAKHFPGAHAAVDAHLDLATVNLDLRQLRRRSLVPFVAAIGAGVAGVMVQHNAYPQVTGDRLPATMSPAIYDLLRRRLGFEGFIITDNMSMGAVARHFAPEEALPARGAAVSAFSAMPSSQVALARAILGSPRGRAGRPTQPATCRDAPERRKAEAGMPAARRKARAKVM
jgi:beta-N-acetylhexosaminidase